MMESEHSLFDVLKFITAKKVALLESSKNGTLPESLFMEVVEK